jgi:hypothetical protein
MFKRMYAGRLCLLVILSVGQAQDQQANALYLIKQGGKSGFINKTGTLLIKDTVC